MEEELNCPICKQLFNNPVLLPCYHSLCLNCAVNAHQTHNQQQTSEGGVESSENNADYPDGDKVSLLSETDSGVVCNSRPNSYVGTPNIQGIIFPPLLQTSASLSLTCPVCQKVVYFDENGVHNLPKNRALLNIVDKYEESKNLKVKCQLCETNPKDATVMCEQCEVFYCEMCRDNCHPSRGPLAKHSLITPQQGKGEMRAKFRNRETKCCEHADETVSTYCMLCKASACSLCLQEGRHANHDVQALNSMCRALKTDLSQNLQALSEKAKGATEFIQRLKGANERILENCVEKESEILEQCSLLMQFVESRKSQLVDYVRSERDYKMRSLKDQVSSCTAKLQNTTGLLQFCIEALKETDSAAFLQIGSALINRVCNFDVTWQKEMTSSSRISADFNLTLDLKSVQHSIEQLTFTQMKPPGPPSLILEECTSENNGITLAWQPHPNSFVEGYILELDDGNNSSYREVYCGKETICTVDGLHFNSVYNARVKAFNSTGDGPYTDSVCLHTAEVAYFSLDPATAHPDIILSNDNTTVSCQSYEHRVVLGNIGFSRGVHYWEVTLDRYDNSADPAFGIARFDVSKDVMLGKDDKGWSMYIDHQRSWFMHFDKHENRVEGGIECGSVIGVLLDLNSCQISFYVNEEMQGPIAFEHIHGVFYPAISINRNVQVTIQSAIDPPCSSDQESDGAESGVGSTSGRPVISQ